MKTISRLVLLIVVLAASAAELPPGERRGPRFIFNLDRYTTLEVGFGARGYDLVVVFDGKGVSERLPFEAFLQSEAPQPRDDFTLEKTDGDGSVLLRLTNLGGRVNEGNRYNVNAGDWRLRVEGRGAIFDRLRATLLERRVADFWPDGNLDFYGTQPNPPGQKPRPAAPPDGRVKLLIGKWQAARHLTQYFADGTFILDPTPDSPPRGRWRIEGNQLIQSYSEGGSSVNTILSIDRKTLVIQSREGRQYTLQRVD